MVLRHGMHQDTRSNRWTSPPTITSRPRSSLTSMACAGWSNRIDKGFLSSDPGLVIGDSLSGTMRSPVVVDQALTRRSEPAANSTSSSGEVARPCDGQLTGRVNSLTRFDWKLLT